MVFWKGWVFFSITVPLSLLWRPLGLFIDFKDTEVLVTIWGPIYFFIGQFVAIGFRSVLPIAVGMGSTRKQCLKSLYIIGTPGIAVSLFLVNVLFILSDFGIVSINMMHIASFFLEDYPFLSFFLIDLAIACFLFGILLLISCIHYCLGFVPMIISLTILGVLIAFLGIMDPLMDWVVGLEPAAFFAMAGGLGLLSIANIVSNHAQRSFGEAGEKIVMV
ncbi:hypothetical protein SAMN05421663_11532 [Terribacillus halophilus]|uniref:Uncharacterized protein n=1 Tax=Terribacillus halophilus TaxID=361279 RepID=A0A1G6W7A0_9BACI|nr:hypothetical protein [Terribacillus halophilus]SDD61810.1 hypothetical protein SAMN05421663_11532 [Terribacillus halophilus]